VRAFAAKANPDAVYHLAAIAYGPDARRDIDSAVRVTVGGTENLMDACARLARPPLVVVVSSAEVYGPNTDRNLVESDQVGPLNPYGATKLAQEQIGLAYHLAGALEVAVVRAFNHIGPGQRSEFVVPAFATQLAAIEAAKRPPTLEVGNLDAVRDFTDVRDVVAAYRLIAEKRCTGRPLNVASGVGIRIRDLVERLIKISGVGVSIVQDPSRMRANELQRIVGDAGALRQLTGWEPQIQMDQTLRDVWEDARLRVASGAGDTPQRGDL
jgi:GDP-4-dehydro-6-deoxy-D-mannose reductase